LAGGGKPKSRIVQLRFWVDLLWAPAALLAMNFAWLNIPDRGEITVPADPNRSWNMGEIILRPVDLLLRRKFLWRCRFLAVEHRRLVDRVWKQEAVAALRAGDTKTALAAIEGVVVRNPTLRFANLGESRLYYTAPNL
jgi:hypothetical protein